MIMDLDSYLSEKRSLINKALTEFLPREAPPAIIAAMRYCLEGGGKRLRPVLTLATAETMGCPNEEVLDVACAVEMVHTYSLVHDDLPAMDNSDFRRGQPSCHRVYGEGEAILVGDALLTLAFSVLAAYGSRWGREKVALDLVRELARASGVEGMIGGQHLDLASAGKRLGEEELEQLSALKTGALLRASVICGGIAAGVDSRSLAILDSFATAAGTAFQVVDDLLDMEGTREDLGKPTGADSLMEKATYPAFFGVANARRKAYELYETALSALGKLDRPAPLLEGLAHKMVYRSR